MVFVSRKPSSSDFSKLRVNLVPEHVFKVRFLHVAGQNVQSPDFVCFAKRRLTIGHEVQINRSRVMIGIYFQWIDCPEKCHVDRTMHFQSQMIIIPSK